MSKKQKHVPAQPAGSKAPIRNAGSAGLSAAKTLPWWLPLALSVGFFMVELLMAHHTIKILALVLIPVTIVCCLFRLSKIGARITLPMLAIAAWVLINGLSMFYAVSGSFALKEFLKIIVSFCGFLLILAWSRRGAGQGRTVAAMLEGATALASIISVDMISTRLLSDFLFRLLNKTDYASVKWYPLEPGVRMNSLYENPNVFAGVAGLAILLGLGAAITSENKRERRFHLICLYLNALAFLLVFSMGASAVIAVAFVVFLLLERRERKGALLLLMVETLVLVGIAVVPIYLTAFGGWTGIQPIPLLCAGAGAAMLCVADHFVGRPLGEKMREKVKLVPVAMVVALALVAAYVALAWNITGPASLTAGESLRRAAYPAPGAYTLEVNATAPVKISIYSQNRAETMMHTQTTLYEGEAQGASFTVPEDSNVVYFAFTADQDVTMESVAYTGENEQGSLPLHYRLLPGFIANRLQGLFANQNAIQRTVFFEDGMKLFVKSPVIGQGLGTFETADPSVQSFYYETKYVHNHYVETLLSTGIIGLVFFVGMLALCGLVLWKNLRREDGDPLVPTLAAAFLFMAGHAAVEVVLSFHAYLPVAFGVLGLICVCCGDELPLRAKSEDFYGWTTVGILGLMAVFGITLYLNVQAEVRNSSGRATYQSLVEAAQTDLYEGDNYKLSYVYMLSNAIQAQKAEATGPVYEKANQYAEQLSKKYSNSTPPHLARYYFITRQQEKAFAMLEKHVTYQAAASEAWNEVFALLAEYSDGSAAYRTETEKLYQQLLSWNERNMGNLTLDKEIQAYVDHVLGE